MDNKTTTNEEIVIENSENWYVLLQRGIVLDKWGENGDKLFVQHKVGKQLTIYATFPPNVATNNPYFDRALEQAKTTVLKNEETWNIEQVEAKEKLEKLGYIYWFDGDNYSVYSTPFKGSNLYIIMSGKKIKDYYVNVQETIHSEYELERVKLAYEELQKNIKELKEELNK